MKVSSLTINKIKNNFLVNNEKCLIYKGLTGAFSLILEKKQKNKKNFKKVVDKNNLGC